MVFAEMSINMLLKIVTAERTDWFDNMKKAELTQDAFFIQRTELIMETIIVVMIVIIIFSTVTIVLVRNIQLRHLLCEIGIFRVLGYNRSRLLDVCMIEPVTDIMIAFPISILLSTFIWGRISKTDMVSFMLEMINNTIWIDISSYVVCAGIMILVTIIHTKIFLERSLKKGIRYMLGQGVE